MQEVANAADELAGRAWDGEFTAIQPQQIAPHYWHCMAVQTIPPDVSILGNHTRDNNNISRQNETTGNVEYGNGPDNIN